jgi:hypothetical protein
MGDHEMSLAWQESHQITSVDLEEFQDLFQGVSDLVIDSFRRKNDQPGGEVGQQSFKLEPFIGCGLRGRPCLIVAIHSCHLCLLPSTAGV